MTDCNIQLNARGHQVVPIPLALAGWIVDYPSLMRAQIKHGGIRVPPSKTDLTAATKLFNSATTERSRIASGNLIRTLWEATVQEPKQSKVVATRAAPVTSYNKDAEKEGDGWSVGGSTVGL